jgi:malonate transporter MadL subunit
MIIYGVALLAICTLAGVVLGDMLGMLLGVKSNVGGVGIAMILLICARLYMQKRGGMTKDCEMGVGFWGAMYIPVVVAMAAQQNVVTALRGGPVAILAAIGSVVVCACVIALISRINRGEPLPKEDDPTLVSPASLTASASTTPITPTTVGGR